MKQNDSKNKTVVVAGASGHLANSLRFAKEKNKILLREVVALEDELINRQLGDYADVISPETRKYWGAQLLTNRAAATAVLDQLVIKTSAMKAAKPVTVVEPERRSPLHNRKLVRPVARLPKTDEVANSKAVAIRNRAHEMAKSQNIPFAIAFRRAERETVS